MLPHAGILCSALRLCTFAGLLTANLPALQARFTSLTLLALLPCLGLALFTLALLLKRADALLLEPFLLTTVSQERTDTDRASDGEPTYHDGCLDAAAVGLEGAVVSRTEVLGLAAIRIELLEIEMPRDPASTRISEIAAHTFGAIR
ncbi:hypothetical protein [Serinibacter salmoneus]|uniref:hypothetical protein n=1 Tax=Serinibacter salmoneus TaxID=556530 RepID=UPI000BF4E8AA|nr:hypothetical protein [Serinibacter salmoneus]